MTPDHETVIAAALKILVPGEDATIHYFDDDPFHPCPYPAGFPGGIWIWNDMAREHFRRGNAEIRADWNSPEDYKEYLGTLKQITLRIDLRNHGRWECTNGYRNSKNLQGIGYAWGTPS